MATLSRLVFILLLLFFFLGKLFPYIDIFIFLFAIINIFSQKKYEIKNKNLFIFFLIVILSSLRFQNIINFLYAVRLFSLISLILFPINLNNFQNKFLNIILYSTVFFGFIQYIFFPDFTAFSSLNWDPHLYRLVGTYFDPTFTGLIFLFILIYLYFSKIKYKNIFLMINYIAIALTYSRSTLISFLFVFSYIFFIKKNYKNILYILIIFFSTILLLPRMEGEGTKLERTSSIFAKIENYKQGLNIFAKNPIIGIGYNNIPSLNYKNNLSSHSNSGFDSSLLTIAITTGIIGLIFLLLGLHYEFVNGNIFYQALLIAILIHSLFANSLFYPYTFLLLALLKTQKLSQSFS